MRSVAANAEAIKCKNDTREARVQTSRGQPMPARSPRRQERELTLEIHGGQKLLLRSRRATQRVGGQKLGGQKPTAAAEVIHCCLRRLAARSFPARVIGSEDFCDVGEPLGALTTASAGVAGCGSGRGDAASLLKSSIVSASFCGSGGSDGKA